MSKLWIFIKTNLKISLKQSPKILFTYLFIPLLFTIFLGFSFGCLFQPETSIDPIDITVENQDERELGAVFEEGISSEDSHSVFNLVEEEAEFQVTVLPNYSEDIRDTPITITPADGASNSNQGILTNFIMSFQESILEEIELTQSLGEINNPAVASNLQASLEHSAQIFSESLFESQEWTSTNSLTSTQFMSVAGIIYILVLSMGSYVSLATDNQFTGINKRLDVLPLNAPQNVLYNLVVNGIQFFFIIVIYMIIWRLMDLSTFAGNPLIYLGWTFIYTLFFSSLNFLLFTLFPGKVMGVIFQLVNFAVLLLGILPLDQLLNNELGALLEGNFIRTIFQQPMFQYIQYNEVFSGWPVALGLIISTIFFIVINIIFIYRKEFN